MYVFNAHHNKVDCKAANSGLIFIKLALFDMITC